jgi:hypothetical protein
MHVIRFFEAINGADFRMIKRRQDLRFTLKAGESLGIGCEGLRQNFQGDVASELGIPRSIHFAHATRAEGGEDFVRAEARTSGKRHGLHRLGPQPTDLHEEAREVVNATLADNLPVLHVVQDRRRKTKGLASRL